MKDGGFDVYADILFFSAVNYRDPSPLMQVFLDINPDLILISGLGVTMSGVHRDGRKYRGGMHQKEGATHRQGLFSQELEGVPWGRNKELNISPPCRWTPPWSIPTARVIVWP